MEEYQLVKKIAMIIADEAHGEKRLYFFYAQEAKEIIELVRKKDKEKQFLFRCFECYKLKPRKGSKHLNKDYHHMYRATCADCAKKLIKENPLNKLRLHFDTGVEAEQSW